MPHSYVPLEIHMRVATHYRVAKTHRMPYLYSSFSQESPILSGSFAQNDLQLKASYGSSPPCSTHTHPHDHTKRAVVSNSCKHMSQIVWMRWSTHLCGMTHTHTRLFRLFWQVADSQNHRIRKLACEAVGVGSESVGGVGAGAGSWRVTTVAGSSVTGDANSSGMCAP